jgi:DMSO/TMAO reductase YedYZ heme-binding membrane subunit
MTKLPLKTFLLIFGLLTLIVRLFYFQIDNNFGVKPLDISIIFLLISGLILLILTIITATKKDFKPLIIWSRLKV